MKKIIFLIFGVIVAIVSAVFWWDYKERLQITFTEQLVEVIDSKNLEEKKNILNKMQANTKHQKLLIALWKHNLQVKEKNETIYEDCVTNYSEYSLVGECLRLLNNDLGNERYLPKYLTILRKKEVNVYQILTYISHDDKLFSSLLMNKLKASIKQ